MCKTWGFFLVAQDIVLSHCAKFQFIINFFWVSMYLVVFLPDYNSSFHQSNQHLTFLGKRNVSSIVLQPTDVYEVIEIISSLNDHL